MSARRIARELFVILLPQLPKDHNRLDKLDMDTITTKAVQMLTDYAKHCLADANAFLVKSQQLLLEEEIDHPSNTAQAQILNPIKVTSTQLRQHLDLMERAMHLTSEALDIPQMRLEPQETEFLFSLMRTYLDQRTEVDRLINKIKMKWRVERMVSIDRDIIRLACTEAFFMPDVPINVCISEAVELSHRFADDRAAKFINGILSDLVEEAKYYRRTGKFAETAELTAGPEGNGPPDSEKSGSAHGQ